MRKNNYWIVDKLKSSTNVSIFDLVAFTAIVRHPLCCKMAMGSRKRWLESRGAKSVLASANDRSLRVTRSLTRRHNLAGFNNSRRPRSRI